MSAAVENGVEASKPRGVFSRAFAKRAQPFEEGESSEKQMVSGITVVHMGLLLLVIGRLVLCEKHSGF